MIAKDFAMAFGAPLNSRVILQISAANVNMDKPTIFLSHSSKDERYLSLLKRKLETITSGVLDVFVSSDGQSIPFGTNWVHRIEAALDSTSTMFAVVSPASIMAPWLYFETGFAYSRNARVVPVAINGVNLEEIRPPLSLLQGFNIKSHHGLNNIVAVINEQYKLSFPEKFSESDFDDLTRAIGASVLDLTSISKYVDHIEFAFPRSFRAIGGETFTIASDFRRVVSEGLSVREDIFRSHDELVYRGVGFVVEVASPDNEAGPALTIQADPFALRKLLGVVEQLVATLYNGQLDKFWFQAHLRRGHRVETTDYKLSSRLATEGVSFSDDNSTFFVYDGLLFTVEDQTLPPSAMPAFPTKIDHVAWVRVVFNLGSNVASAFGEVIDVLERSRVISSNAI